jgi:hypothetical protein
MAASSIDQALRCIRTRRYVALGLLVAFLPFVAAFSSFVHSGAAMNVAVAIYLGLFVGALAVFGFSSCPRCHNLFFVAGLSNPFSSRCMHCGLPIAGE